jgi:hypothetical protein
MGPVMGGGVQRGVSTAWSEYSAQYGVEYGASTVHSIERVQPRL